jgi:D-3-phosphoglycerate dehydrogenase
VLVSDAISEEGLAVLRADPDVEVTARTDLSAEQLLEAIPEYHALMVRSQTKVTREVIEGGRQLVVIGRAGVGVDNIDVAAATERGIVVCNSPGGNTIAATEHTLALLLAVSRHIPQANASAKAGEWKRSKFLGVELYNKTLGIIGLGKIGSEVARRMKAMGMEVVAYDPKIGPETAARLGVELVELEELLARADYITLHAPLTRETRHLIGAKELARAKDRVRVINCSRGGLVDEEALAEALRCGKVAAAACDVFEREPPEGSPLLEMDNVIVTPHLGASTEEAQVKVALDVGRQIVEVLNGRPAYSAVNVAPLSPEALAVLQPYLGLAEKLGRLQAQLNEGRFLEAETVYSGELGEQDCRVVTAAFLKGLLENVLDVPVNYVNAELAAEQRGVKVTESKSSTPHDYASLISARVSTDQSSHVVAGTVFGKRDLRVVGIDEYRVNFCPDGHMLIAMHWDRPGVIGKVGTILGNGGVNIAGMQVGREQPRGFAVMVLTVDSPIPEELMAQVSQVDSIVSSRLVEL